MGGLGGLFSAAPPPTGGTPTLVLRSIFDDEESRKRMDAHQKQIEDLIATNRRLADQVERMVSRTERAETRRSKTIIGALRKWRWEIITLMFFINRLGRAVAAFWNMMGESAESAVERGGVRALARMYEVDLGAIANTLRSVSDETLSVRESIQIVQSGLLEDQGQFVQAYSELWEAARIAAATSGGEATEHFKTFIQAIVEGDGEILDSSTTIYQGQLALQKYAEAAGTTVDALDPLVKSEVLLHQILRITDDLLDEGAGAAFDQAAGYEAVKASAKDLKDALGTVSLELINSSAGFQILDELIERFAKGSIIAVAGMAALEVGARRMGTAFWEASPLARIPGFLDLVGKFGTEETPAQAFARVFKAGQEALGEFRDEVDAGAFNYERIRENAQKSLNPIVDHLLRREEMIEEYNLSMEKITRDHNDKLMDLEIRHQQDLDKLHRDAERREAKSERTYNRNVENEGERYLIREAQALEDHLLKMEEDRREYYLRSLQNERMYYYERGLLVAYGDVLAIEDLDARYALEQQAREENFMEKQRQEEEGYELDADQRKEDYEQRLYELKKAFDAQLLEIRISLQNQIVEEHIQHEEARRQAIRDYEQRLADEQEMHNRALRQWDEQWGRIARQTEVGANAITRILEEYFGPGGEATGIVTNFLAYYERMAEVQSMVERITGRQAGTTTTKSSDTYTRWSGFQHMPRGYQFGGSGIITRPSLVPMGEGHTPEMFQVTPLSVVGSVLTISWAGGPIPIHGQGAIAGADLSALGNAITKGIVVALDRGIQEVTR